MILNERQKKILAILNETGNVRVSGIARDLFFSEMTIRRDLEKMERDGLLKRTHGGAVVNRSDFQYPINYRAEINKDQKKHLAAEATKYLSDEIPLRRTADLFQQFVDSGVSSPLP